MSRKGNSPDNGMVESEIFYGYEKTFKLLNQLGKAMVDYIDYYKISALR